MAWTDRLLAYDDAVLSDLCSPGLLRRAYKQAEKNPIRLQDDDGSRAMFSVGGQTVQLADAPLDEARCDCAASGVCVHILAAVISARAAPPQTPGAELCPAAKETLNPVSELQRYSPEIIMRWAGKSATRKAAELLAKSAPSAPALNPGDTSIELALNAHIRCRYLAGGGLDGVICDAPQSRRKSYIAACLLYWWQQQGREIPWPEQAERSTPALSAQERRLIGEVRTQLSGLLSAGLMHHPAHIVATLRSLAWSARGEKMPRLSAAVLALSSALADFNKGGAAADALALFNRIVSVWALCESLQRSGDETLARWRGQLRRVYAMRETGVLWLAGAYHYYSRDGAQGLGLVFFDLQDKTPLRMNIGRTGEAARTFSLAAAWQSAIGWHKGKSPRELSGLVIALKNSRISSDNKLSQSGKTELLSTVAASDFSEQIEALAYSRWRDLLEHLAGQLDAPQMLSPVLAKTASLSVFTIAEYEQQWQAWAKDDSGQWLCFALPVSDIHNARVERFNRIINAFGNVVWAVLAEPQLSRQVLTLQPVAVVLRDGNEWLVLNPDLEQADTRRMKKKWKSWLNRLQQRKTSAARKPPAPVLYPTLLETLALAQDALLGYAELGVDCSVADINKAQQLHRQLSVADAPFLAGALNAALTGASPAALMRAQYLLNLAVIRLQLLSLCPNYDQDAKSAARAAPTEI